MARIPQSDRLLLAKIQPTANTDSAPDAATNAVRTRNLSFTPFEGGKEKLNYDGPGFGNTSTVLTSIYGVVEFEVDLTGSGTAGDAPAYGPLLRGCGMSETIAVGTDVQYDPIDESQEALTLHFIHRTELHALTDAKGSFTIATNREGFPVLRFRFLGLQVDPTTVAPGTPDFAAWQRPLPITKANTTVMELDGFEVRLEELSIDFGNQVEFRDVTYQQDVFIAERETSGSITIEKPALADKNFYTLVRGENIVDLDMTHGPAGNQVKLDGRVQPMMQADGESQGIATLPFNLDFIPTYKGAGDEFKLTVL